MVRFRRGIPFVSVVLVAAAVAIMLAAALISWWVLLALIPLAMMAGCVAMMAAHRRMPGAPSAAALAVAAWARARLPATSPAAWGWPLATALVCAPLVYPWYLVWVAPFLVARSTRPLLVWTVSIQAAYVAWDRPPGAPWAVPGGALFVEYGALAIAAAWAWSGARRERAARTLTAPEAAP